jgi:hypothetical protein
MNLSSTYNQIGYGFTLDRIIIIYKKAFDDLIKEKKKSIFIFLIKRGA